jgi:heme/copper-type cytochrome/quinol oxidase subunit 2
LTGIFISRISGIRCNRGDRLHLTFSTDDTGHSFFLEEFDADAKVSPGAVGFILFNPNKPILKPEIKNELVIIASHPGLQKYLVSKSQFRCHVWCGLLHAFEQGSLIIQQIPYWVLVPVAF